MHNSLAELALILWLPITVLLFAILPAHFAAVTAALGGMLLLPESVFFEFVGFPELGKHQIIWLALLIAGLLWHLDLLLKARPGRGPEVLLLLLALGAVGTALVNSQPISLGGRDLPGTRLWDALAYVANYLLMLLLPFFLGKAFFRSPRSLRVLLGGLAASGLLYSLPTLFEARMYPRLHEWVYGFNPQSHLFVYRLGGWRPLVFFGNGLALGIFALVATLAATTLARYRTSVLGIPGRIAAVYLGLVLVVCKSLNALVLGSVLLPITALLRPQRQALLAALLAAAVLAYPLARTIGLVPTQQLVEATELVSAERSRSLAFRFDNEDRLMERVKERLVFGWGGYERNQVYIWHGRVPVPVIFDSYWMILLSNSGLIGMLGVFSLLLAPVLAAASRVRRIPRSRDRQLVAGLALIVVAYAVDLLPNGLFVNASFFFSGALWGSCSELRARSRATQRSRGTRRRPEAKRMPQGLPRGDSRSDSQRLRGSDRVRASHE